MFVKKKKEENTETDINSWSSKKVELGRRYQKALVRTRFLVEFQQVKAGSTITSSNPWQILIDLNIALTNKTGPLLSEFNWCKDTV